MQTTCDNTIHVLLVEDHRVVRAGLRMLIESQPHMKVVGEAASQDEALALAAAINPNVILLDLCLGDGVRMDSIQHLQAAAPMARILLLTGVTDPQAHRHAIRSGALGIVSKEQAAEVLLKAITKVHAGEVWVDRLMMAHILTDMMPARTSADSAPHEAQIASLTTREREVIELLCEGLQNRTIGDRLSITETTVRHHLTSIFNRLGVASRLELVIYAYRHGLVKPPVA